MTQAAILALEDGTLFHGRSIGAEGQTVGEVVFNTAITGYQEILTDPSYHQQIVTFTQPHIGNVGVNPEDEESGEVYAAGLIIRQLPYQMSNWRAQGSLPEYLCRKGVVAIHDIDTRKLTRLLRDKGAQNGCLMAGATLDTERAVAAARAFPGLKGADLAKVVSTRNSYEWAEGCWSLDAGLPDATVRSDKPWRVIAYDFGVKRNILRILVDLGCRVTVVPATTPAVEVLRENPDGVFLSNGPGDPDACDYAIAAIRDLLPTRIPIFGICLGHQLLALACDARTVKMKFGHHGANHPVQELATGRVMITSQNHGFTVEESSLPPELLTTHRSLFDRTLQGVRHRDLPAFSFQGHPEASPGPHDIKPLFNRFIELMEARK
ncbi:MAG: carbamoyl phosphate synthase small subunit [Gammaproteobacteria bacterium RIFCSPLOWO2_02_FULL_61_13]|nr:MAG: carbamoyl phosphate synthase small subunit [Gammaproteobacteria bacterium RIFCSPLOWO2_02_FULL_61_13]